MKRISVLFCSMVLTLCAMAVPARPGSTIVTMDDGTQAIQQIHGDESYHWMTLTSLDGQPLSSTFNQASEQRANARRVSNHQRRTNRRRFGEFTNITGTKKGLIILVSYSNKAFVTTQTQWNNQFNQQGYSGNNHIGSVADYFRDQSYGLFNLEFDVVGPVTVSKTLSYYGSNDSDGNDQHAAEMISEAIRLADTQYNVDYSQYDWSGDGYVDQVFVVYAGYGEAMGAPANTIWPHEWSLDAAHEYLNDGNGAITLDGVTIDTYACSCELNNTSGSEMAPIGCACHEFSHCLGYPDLYDTGSNDNFGMGGHDLMDYGAYGGSNYGNVPVGFSAYERWIAGWLTPVELNNDTTITDMPALNDTAVAYVLYNDNNHNEYFLLENRQTNRWFSYCNGSTAAGHGLLISHIDYDHQVWEENTVNNTTNHQRLTIVPADKRYSLDNMPQDFFPYSSTNAFTNTSHTSYGGKLFNRNTDGTYYLNKPITSITESNGKVSFVCMNGTGGGSVTPDDPATPDPEGAIVFTPSSAASVTSSGVTIAYGQGNGGNAPTWNSNSSQLRLYSNNTITISASSAIAKIELLCAKQGSKTYTTLSANCGTLTSGGTSTSNTDIKTDTWTGNANQVVFTLGTSGQRIITKVIVYPAQGGSETPDPVDPEDPGDDQPAGDTIVVTNTENAGSNMAYNFTQNGITVSCTVGARTESYFGCNAGQRLTFSAGRAIKSIAINGYVKSEFEASADHGEISYVDASTAEQTADPVLVIRDIDATSVTISCVKQLRCYSATIYFTGNADAIVNDGNSDPTPSGEYNYDYEPTTITTITHAFTSGETDVTYLTDYNYIELFLSSDDYYADMVFMTDHSDDYTVIPTGTYQINSTYALGTINSSVGGDDQYDYPSFLATDFDSEGYYSTAYYMMSGDVVVSRVNGVGTRIVVTAITYNGSTLNLTYQGNLTGGELPTGVEHVANETITTKHIKDGQLIIRTCRGHFNALGQQVR